MQISIILIAGLVFLFSFDLGQSDGKINLFLTITTTLAFTFLPGIIAYFWGVVAAKRLPSAVEDRIRQLYVLKQAFRSFEIIILVAFIVEIYYLKLPLLVDRWLGFLTFNYTRRLLVIFPLVFGILLVRISQYELDKRARLTRWSRRGFLSFSLKMMLLPVIPLFGYLALADIIDHSPIQIRTFFIAHSYINLLLLVILIVFAYVKAPMLLRFIWPAKPLQDRELRDRLDNLAHNHGIKYKDILVWQTGGAKIANAGVSGILPGSRCIFMTEYLLENFSHDEIETIIAHEFGHVKHWHIHIYLAFSLVYFACYALFYSYIGPMLERIVGDGPIVSAAITIGFFCLYFVLLFRYFSRKLERQADIYAVEVTGKPEVFKKALWRLSTLNYIPRAIKKLSEIMHTHPSIIRRIHFVDLMIAGDRKAMRYKKTLLEAKTVLLLTPILLALFILNGRNALAPPADVHYEIGRQYYNEAIKEKKKNADASPAEVSLAEKNYREKFNRALLEFQKSIELDPKHEDAYYGLGVVYTELEMYEKAAWAFKRLLEINPEDKEVQETLKLVEEQLRVRSTPKTHR